MQSLTPRQKAIYDYIVAFREEHGCSPSIPELQRAFLIRSPNGVVGHLLALEAKGHIRRSKRGSRQIDIVGERPAKARSELFSVPLLFRPPAAGERVRASVSVTGSTLLLGFEPPPESYALLSPDDSMRFAGILSGDLVVVEANTQPRDEAVVVALTEGGGYVFRRLVKVRGVSYLRAEPNARGERTPLAGAEVVGVIRTVVRRLSG